mgnify:FL=1
MSLSKFEESVTSRFEDISRDGPGLETSILELTDNSLDWGGSKKITITYDINTGKLLYVDYSPQGFKTREALERFFRLGERNLDVATNKIGKYGKGGYKALINIAKYIHITSYFDNTGHSIGTNFIEMQSKNTYIPTNLYNTVEYNGENRSEFDLELNHRYLQRFSCDNLVRHLKRAYHKEGSNVEFVINGISVIPSEHCPFGEFRVKKMYVVYYDVDKDVFTSDIFIPSATEDSDDEDNNVDNNNLMKVGLVTLYILKQTLKKNELLGTHPGIDIYRNNRLCNTKNPLTGLGDIGRFMSNSEMRGNMCHMTFEYENHKLTDIKYMDDQMGLTTWKEIVDDNKEIDETLLKILQEKASECNDMYEKYINNLKNTHIEQVNLAETTIAFIKNCNNTQLIQSNVNLETIKQKYQYLVDFKTSYFDKDDLTIKYCKSKAEVKEKKKTNDSTKTERKNTEIMKRVNQLVDDISILIEKKANAEISEAKIHTIMKEHSMSHEEAEKYILNCDIISVVKSKISNAKTKSPDEKLKLLEEANRYKFDDEDLHELLEKEYSIAQTEYTVHLQEEEEQRKVTEQLKKDLLAKAELEKKAQEEAKALEEETKALEEETKALEEETKALEKKEPESKPGQGVAQPDEPLNKTGKQPYDFTNKPNKVERRTLKDNRNNDKCNEEQRTIIDKWIQSKNGSFNDKKTLDIINRMIKDM